MFSGKPLQNTTSSHCPQLCGQIPSPLFHHPLPAGCCLLCCRWWVSHRGDIVLLHHCFIFCCRFFLLCCFYLHCCHISLSCHSFFSAAAFFLCCIFSTSSFVTAASSSPLQHLLFCCFYLLCRCYLLCCHHLFLAKGREGPLLSPLHYLPPLSPL